MKLKNIFKSTALAAFMLSAGACSDDIFYPDGTWTGEIPDEWTMTLVIPDPQIVNVGGTRAYDGTLGVERINVILYQEEGDTKTILENTLLTESDWKVNDEDQTVTVTVPLDKNASHIAVVLNAPSSYTTKTEPSEVFVKDALVDELGVTYPVLWGKQTIKKTIENKTMPLLRNTAMVTVKMDQSKVDNFDISLVGVFGTAEEGSLGPVTVDSSAGLPTSVTEKVTGSPMNYLPAASDAGANMKAWQENAEGDVVSMSLSGFYETLAHRGAEDGNTMTWNGKTVGKDIPRVIIKGRYTDKSDGTSIEGYYVVALSERSEADDKKFSEHPDHFTYGDLLPILRNHNYVINITEVRGDGWPNLNQAMQALPDNRLTVEVEDNYVNITDIEATRDYYLGVGADVVASFDGNATIEIVTSYPGVPSSTVWKDRLDFETDEDWIHVDDTSIEYDSEKEGAGNAIIYTLTVPLDRNEDSSDRYGKIRVRAGKLSREIYVTQEGQPYTRMRPIVVKGMSSTDIPNYFSWIEGVAYNEDGTVDTSVVVTDSVQGMSRSSNRNVQRRNGLHFPAVPLYNNVVYEFEAKGGESASVSEGAANFKVELDETNKKYKVSLVNPSEPGIATGRLKISNFNGTDGLTVEYPLYRTGIIHYLDPSSSQYQPDVAEVLRTGWFYYEVVKKGDTYVLDRDLGAASNAFFTKGSAVYRKNTRAVGGYFKVNSRRWIDYKNTEKDANVITRREDQETITAKLGLIAEKPENGRFVMAREADVLAWGIDTEGPTVCATGVTGRVADNTIYFPKAGYYEGDELKSDMHTIFWTRTYLGGTQGLGADSDEYGYWYRYYDDMKSTNPENRFSNISMARGAGVSGKAPDANSIWRYMPLRLVWVNKDCMNPGASTVVDNTVTDKIIIYFNPGTTGWENVRYHYWDMNANPANTTWSSRPYMTKLSDSLWKAELPLPNNGGGLVISNPFQEPGNEGQTVNINLGGQYQNGNTVLYITPTTQVSDGNNNGKWNVSIEASAEDKWGFGNTSTPTERQQVTIMVENVANWYDSKIRFEYQNRTSYATKYHPDFDGAFMDMVRYDGKKYFRYIIKKSKLTELNDDDVGFRLRRQDESGWKSFGDSKVEMSENKTQEVFFYKNKTNSGNLDYDSSKTSIDESKLSIGWETATPTEQYLLRGDFNDRGWEVNESDKFIWNSTLGQFELTIDISSVGDYGFVIARKGESSSSWDDEWGKYSNQVNGGTKVQNGKSYNVVTNKRNQNDYNWNFPADNTTYKLVFKPNGSGDVGGTLTVTW